MSPPNRESTIPTGVLDAAARQAIRPYSALNSPTNSQQDVLKFILQRWDAGEALPSCREIARHFNWSSPKAASDVLDALKRKGYLASDLESSRKYRLTEQSIGLPVLGEIPAGPPASTVESREEYLALNPSSLGVRDRTAAFLLRVTGDSMVGRQIFDGDLVLVEKSSRPKHQNIVAALIDNEVTLKTLIKEDGNAWLQSENPKYPNIHPLEDLQIQGVVRAVVRQLTP